MFYCYILVCNVSEEFCVVSIECCFACFGGDFSALPVESGNL